MRYLLTYYYVGIVLFYAFVLHLPSDARKISELSTLKTGQDVGHSIVTLPRLNSKLRLIIDIRFSNRSIQSDQEIEENYELGQYRNTCVDCNRETKDKHLKSPTKDSLDENQVLSELLSLFVKEESLQEDTGSLTSKKIDSHSFQFVTHWKFCQGTVVTNMNYIKSELGNIVYRISESCSVEVSKNGPEFWCGKHDVPSSKYICQIQDAK